MANTYIFLTTDAQIDAAYDLLTPSIIQEVKDDFGEAVRLPTRQQIKNWVGDAGHKLLGVHDTGVPLGFGLGERLVNGVWQIIFVMVTDTLTANQRAVTFRGMMLFASAPPLASNTPFMGRMPQGGRLDTVCQARGLNTAPSVRTVLGPYPNKPMVQYDTTAGEIQAKF